VAEHREVSIRLVRVQDAETLSRLETRDREYLQAGGPVRSDHYVSLEGQRELIDRLLEGHRSGTGAPFVIEAHGKVVGRILLAAIIGGGFQSASVGYWVTESMSGRGIASRALRLLVAHAFGERGLHRLEAATTLDNAASAHILTKAGFEQYGLARDYLRMGGRWRDHRLFQLLNATWTEPAEHTAQVNTR
jgi:ribosomal-protein-alanine N-acetyltransferase